VNDADLARHAHRVLVAWLALLALMFASLGSAYLSMGALNPIAGLAIAAVKSAIVIAFFMGLARASGMVRIVAATGLATWALLAALAGVDYATRRIEPAATQTPHQIEPLRSRRDFLRPPADNPSTVSHAGRNDRHIPSLQPLKSQAAQMPDPRRGHARFE
jgi:cytochrome c oxidase subunit IV